MPYASRESELVKRGHITEDRACLHKRQYLTKGEARHARDRVAKRIGQPMHSYHCPFCGWHHIARNPENNT